MEGDTSLRDYLIDEFVEDYLELRLTRRQALKKLAALTGSVALAQGILAACGPASQPAPQASPTAAATPAASSTAAPAALSVSPNDPAVKAQPVQFPGRAGTVLGYLAQPAAGGPFPAVLVCHENRGMTPHIQDVTRRLAKAGYVGLAVDLLSREGGTDKLDPAGVTRVLGTASPDRFVEDFQSGIHYLKTLSFVRGDRIGMVGFCFGGGVVWRVAAKSPELKAAVPFYGPPPPVEDIPGVQAAVLAIYGALDTRITASGDTMEAAMKQNGKTFERIIYPNAAHAFYNDTGASYNPDAAAAAWIQTLAWFDKYLKA